MIAGPMQHLSRVLRSLWRRLFSRPPADPMEAIGREMRKRLDAAERRER